MPTTIPRIASALALLAALAVLLPSLATAAGPEPERWPVPSGARVSRLRPGLLPGEAHHPEVAACRGFRLTERQVLRFLALARVIDERTEAREFNWSPCTMEGALGWPGGSARLTITALLVGAVKPARGPQVRLGCDGDCLRAVAAEAPAATAGAPRTLVDPGAALGKLRLGDRRAAVRARLGPPTWITGTEARRVETWPAPASLRITFEGDVVRQLESSADGWSTRDGLGSDTPVSTWLAAAARWQVTAYRAARGADAGRLTCSLDDVERGIAITLHGQAGPGTASRLRLVGVVVHPPGLPATPAADLDPAPELAARCPRADRAGRRGGAR